ncbi:MAG TPA: phosphopantetheine-binding protein, partial [Anaerolineae bacterium]
MGIHDNFFELGGNSLLIAQTHHRLREELKSDLSLVDMFKYPTVNALAQHLGRNGHAACEHHQHGGAHQQVEPSLVIHPLLFFILLGSMCVLSPQQRQIHFVRQIERFQRHIQVGHFR